MGKTFLVVLFIVGVFFGFQKALGQLNKVKLIPRLNQQTRVLKYGDFKKTSLYTTRAARYHATFNNPSKSFTMADGTSLHISFIKNPSFASQGDQVTTQLNTGPVHNGPVSVPVNAAAESNYGWTSPTPYHAVVNARSVNFCVTDDNHQQMSKFIFPGAVFTFDEFMNGAYQAPPGGRNGIMLATDHPTSGNFVSVANPTSANVASAVQNMVNHFIGSGHGQTTYKYYESNNMADWTAKLNAGQSGSGTQINTAFSTTDRTHHRYLTIDVTRQQYSIYTSPPEDGFYGAGNRAEATPNLMAVGAVNYGVRLLVNLELSFATNAAAADFKNKFNYEVYTDQLDMGYLQSHVAEITAISAYEIGGTHAGVILMNKNNLQSGINTVLSGLTNQNAKPVGFQLYDMAWSQVGAIASTGLFNYISRTPAPPANPVLTAAMVSIRCTSDGKNKNTTFDFELYKGNDSHSGSIYMYRDGTNNRPNEPNREWPKYATVDYDLLWADQGPGKRLAANAKVIHPTLNELETGNWLLAFDLDKTTIDIFDDVVRCKITLSLTFSNNTTQQISWDDLYVNNDAQAKWLKFNYLNGRFTASAVDYH